MKRIVALCLILLLCLSVAACSREQPPRIMERITEDGSRHTVIEDSQGHMISQYVERTDGSKTTFTYNEDGSYSELGEFADGTIIKHIYHIDGTHIETGTSPDGSSYELTYDQNGVLIQEVYTAPDGSVTRHQYDENGNPIE